MAKVRNYPSRVAGAFGQPEYMRFGKKDRIVIDDIDWRCKETSVFGHILVAEHDKDFKRTYTHAQMRVEASKTSFRHDRDWYTTKAAKLRLRTDVSEMNELSFEDRQKILWKESFILELERLKAKEPDVVTSGDDPLKAAIARVDAIIRKQSSDVEDNGRRKYAGRIKIFFDAPGPKAFRTWRKVYMESDRDPLALRDGHHRSGRYDERMSSEQLEYIKTFVRQLLSRNKPKIRAKWRSMKARIQTDNETRAANEQVKVPSYGRFKKAYDELDEFEKLVGREGIDAAVRECQAVGEGVVDLERALQEVEIDHWTVGLRTILSKARIWHRLNRASRRNLQKVRMVLGAAKCRRTHCVLGMVLSRTPSVESAIRLIEMVVSNKKRFADAAGCKTPYDIYGVPEFIWFDGGPAFNNSRMRAVLRDLKIDWDIAPGGLPHLRGMIERLFGTLDAQVLTWFEGRTFSDVVAKGEDYDPDERTGTSVEELGRVLIRYVVDQHHNTPRKELGGETAREAYLNLIKKYPVWGSPDADKLRHAFGFEIKRTLTPGGIRFLNIQYRSKALHEHFLKVGRVEVICRVHPANIGAISVRIGKNWWTVPGPKEFDGVDAETWIAAEAAIRAKMKATEQHITGPIINAAILDIEAHAEIARKRARIDDSPIPRTAVLAAEARMRVFANFPEDRDDDQEAAPTGDLYASTTKVGGGTPVGEKARSGAARASTPPRARPLAKTPSKSTRKGRASSPKTAAAAKPKASAPAARKPPQARRPGLKRTFSAED